MSSFEIASRTGYADPDRRSTSVMNGRPIRSRTSPERVVQIRPPASLRKVRTESGFTNSLAIVRSVSSSRPSPSYTRMNSPRRRAASARPSSTNSDELGGVYQDCCRNQFIGPHWEERRPYFEGSHAAHDVGTGGRRARRSGGNAGHHRVAPGPNLRGVAVEREGSFPGGWSAAHFPSRNGRLRDRGGLDGRGGRRRTRRGRGAPEGAPHEAPPGERRAFQPSESARRPHQAHGAHHLRGASILGDRETLADATERELQGPRLLLGLPRSRPQRARRMDGGSARSNPPAHPPPGPRRGSGNAPATRYHGFPHEAEDEGRADPGRGPHAVEPAPRDAVSRRLREPVPRGAATRRPSGPEADPGLEGEARRIPPNKLNAERRLRGELAYLAGVIDQTKKAIPMARGMAT